MGARSNCKHPGFESWFTIVIFRAGPGSTFWLLQSGLPNWKSFAEKFSDSSSVTSLTKRPLTPIDFQGFDFLQDSGPERDGDNFMAKIQRWWWFSSDPIIYFFFQAWYCHAGVHESKVMKSTRTLFANLQISIQWRQTKSIFSSAYLHIETEKLVGQWYYRRFYTLRPRTEQGFNLGRQSTTFFPLHESFSSSLSAWSLSKWKC